MILIGLITLQQLPFYQCDKRQGKNRWREKVEAAIKLNDDIRIRKGKKVHIMETRSLIAGNGILVIESSADRTRYILEYYEKCSSSTANASSFKKFSRLTRLE